MLRDHGGLVWRQTDSGLSGIAEKFQNIIETLLLKHHFKRESLRLRFELN